MSDKIEAAIDRLNQKESLESENIIETEEQIINRKDLESVFVSKKFDPDDSKFFNDLCNQAAGFCWKYGNPDLIPNCYHKQRAYRKIREALDCFQAAILKKEKYRKKNEGLSND